MANTVIKFQNIQSAGNSQKTSHSSEIYTDVSLMSRYGAMTQHLGKIKGAVPYDLKIDDSEENVLCLDNKKSPTLLTIICKPTEQLRQKLTYRIARSVNVKAVQNAIENIFSFFPGERVLYPAFGSRLKTHLYNGITTFNVEQIVAEIYSNVEQFDQRVVIDDIQAVYDDKDVDDNTVTLRITYHIDGLSAEHYTYDYSYVTGS